MKIVGLLSGGIDSPVALYLLKRKGYDIIPAYFDNWPFSGRENVERAEDCARTLGFDEMFVIPHGKNLTILARECKRRLTCVLCRRMMYRVASLLGRRIGACALATGENLGQVASQTYLNMMAEESASQLPILRPLIGFNKEEIVKISKRIGTYETSIRKLTCCTIVPEKPATKARNEEVEKEEEKVDVPSMMEDSLNNMVVINLKEG